MSYDRNILASQWSNILQAVCSNTLSFDPIIYKSHSTLKATLSPAQPQWLSETKTGTA